MINLNDHFPEVLTRNDAERYREDGFYIRAAQEVWGCSHVLCRKEFLRLVMVVVLKGEGFLETQRMTSPCREGDLLFLAPDAAYRFEVKSEMEVYVVTTEEDEILKRSVELISDDAEVLPLGDAFAVSQMMDLILGLLKTHGPDEMRVYKSFLHSLLWLVRQNLTMGGNGVSSSEQLILRCRRWIRLHAHEGAGVQEMADAHHIDRSHLSRIWRKNAGCSPLDELVAVRMAMAKELISSTPMSISDVAQECGFGDAAVFSKFFRRNAGLPPSVWKKRSKNGLGRNQNQGSDQDQGSGPNDTNLSLI